MEKPTIFFSHSSLDKEAVKILKDKLLSITVNSIDIFVSSDGESIPFGQNWLSKIEEGLKSSRIMFLFITPNSINNMWVSFEAGFGYSKGIHVIPVCFGVSVSDLKPPLSILQGFDLASADSLNNIVSKINQEFNLKCPLSFSEEDYNLMLRAQRINNTDNDLSKIIESLNWNMYFNSEDDDAGRNSKIKTMIEEGLLNATKSFFDKKNIDYSVKIENKDSIALNVAGMTLLFPKEKESFEKKEFFSPYFNIQISPYNLNHSLLILKEYYSEVLNLDELRLSIRLRIPYNIRNNPQDISALIYSYDLICQNKENGEFYHSGEYTIRFLDSYHRGAQTRITTLEIKHPVDSLNPEDLFDLVVTLIKLEIIYIDESLFYDNIRLRKEKEKTLKDTIDKVDEELGRRVRMGARGLAF